MGIPVYDVYVGIFLMNGMYLSILKETNFIDFIVWIVIIRYIVILLYYLLLWIF